ncbi:hypothetical protein BDD12DRAFT_171296 [Trichophaea hybrida]|nr:hypothetical protein BDD12DRAFT_171296 [Trichophaea hybrida]
MDGVMANERKTSDKHSNHRSGPLRFHAARLCSTWPPSEEDGPPQASRWTSLNSPNAFAPMNPSLLSSDITPIHRKRYLRDLQRHSRFPRLTYDFNHLSRNMGTEDRSTMINDKKAHAERSSVQTAVMYNLIFVMKLVELFLAGRAMTLAESQVQSFTVDDVDHGQDGGMLGASIGVEHRTQVGHF